MRPRVLRSDAGAWCRVSREADRSFVFEFGARGEREAYRAFRYPPAQLPTVEDAVTLAAALVQAPPMLAAVSVPAAALAWLPEGPVARRVGALPMARGAYQLPVDDREALRALLAACRRHHADPFVEAEAVNLAMRLERALGAV